MSTAKMIADLLTDRPGLGADPREVADWLDRKAATFEAVAVDARLPGSFVDPAEADEAAAAARAQADEARAAL